MFYYTSQHVDHWRIFELNCYDRNTRDFSTVVSLGDNLPENNYFMSSSAYMLSDDNKIYGMIPTYEKSVITAEDGSMQIQNVWNWNLIKVNNSFSGYDVIYRFDPSYDCKLVGIADNKIYYEKSELSYRKGGIIYSTGAELGLFEYDLKTGAESRVFEGTPRGVPKSDPDGYHVIKHNGKVSFFYLEDPYSSGKYTLLYYDKSGWKEIFSSVNQICTIYNGIQYTNGKFYVPLYTNSYYEMIYYEVDENGSKYIGLGDPNSIVIDNDNTGRLQYINTEGELKDFT